MEKNGKPIVKCLNENHDWEDVSVVVYVRPDGSYSRDYNGGGESKLYRECRRCGEPQIRDWRLYSHYNYQDKPNPPLIDQFTYMEKLRKKFE